MHPQKEKVAAALAFYSIMGKALNDSTKLLHFSLQISIFRIEFTANWTDFYRKM